MPEGDEQEVRWEGEPLGLPGHRPQCGAES